MGLAIIRYMMYLVNKKVTLFTTIVHRKHF